MPSITNLQDLLVHQLRDIYSAEKQLVAALPKMAKQSTSDELEEAFTSHLEQTTGQISRLEQVFEHLGVSARGPKCKAMEGLLEEAKELLAEDIEPNVLDAGIIASAQRVEHYEIAAYGTVVEFARELGHEEVMQLLQQTLEEEEDANEKLTNLAEGGINALAQPNGAPSTKSKDRDGSTSGGKSATGSVGARTAPRRGNKSVSTTTLSAGRPGAGRR